MTNSYPSAHFDSGNSGYIPEPACGQRTRETFDSIWSVETDGDLQASPVVSDEIVVVGDMNGIVYGLNALDGRRHWRTDLDTPTVFASPTVANGTVFVSGYDDLNRTNSTTVAVELATGAIQWTRDFGQGGRTPVATDSEHVYVQTDDGDCRALDVVTGETVWHRDGQRHNKMAALSDRSVVRKDGDSLVAIDTTRGSERWRANLDCRVLTPPVVDGGRVYVITGSSDQWCLDAETGELLWHIDIGTKIREHPDTDDPLLPLGGAILDSKPVTDGESLLVGVYQGVVEIDAADGQLQSYYPLGHRVSDPLLIGESGEKRLYGYVNDGITEYQLAEDAPSPLRSTVTDTLDAAPAYASGVFYVSTELDGVVAVV